MEMSPVSVAVTPRKSRQSYRGFGQQSDAAPSPPANHCHRSHLADEASASDGWPSWRGGGGVTSDGARGPGPEGGGPWIAALDTLPLPETRGAGKIAPHGDDERARTTRASQAGAERRDHRHARARHRLGDGALQRHRRGAAAAIPVPRSGDASPSSGRPTSSAITRSSRSRTSTRGTGAHAPAMPSNRSRRCRRSTSRPASPAPAIRNRSRFD